LRNIIVSTAGSASLLYPAAGQDLQATMSLELPISNE
jgi:hypothetical protein